MNLNYLFMSDGNQALLIITCIIPSQRWSMAAAASCIMGVFQQQGLVKCSEKAENWMQLNTEISLMNLVQSTQKLRLGWKFTFQHDNHPTHTAKSLQECLRYDIMNILEWPSQSWDLEPSLEKPVNGCPPMVPSQPERAWDDLKRRMAKK